MTRRPKGKRYRLIGIGALAHGIKEIWQFRFAFLKYVMEETDKNIVIFIEDTKEHANNIMNDSELELKYDEASEGRSTYGPLNRYAYRAWDSPIYLEIIKYIRANKGRITIIGVDDGTHELDRKMFDAIMRRIRKSDYNFWWAENAHVDSRKITKAREREWASDEEFRCGHYLRKEFKSRYCMILSTGYKGTIRFSSVCDNEACTIRTKPDYPFYENFEHFPYIKYINDPSRKAIPPNFKIYNRTEFPDSFIEFSNPKLPSIPVVIDHKDWNFLLFFDEVNGLKIIQPDIEK